MKLIWCTSKKTWVDPSEQVGARVFVQSDIETLQSPITGETIHTRSQYERHLKAFGHHVSEPGDVGRKAQPDRGEIRAAVKASLNDLGVYR